jgi:glycosyltransferase involved in cell wall biosynthesis
MGLAKGFQTLGHDVHIIMASPTGQYGEKNVCGAGSAIKIIEIPFRLIPVLNEPVYFKASEVLSRGRYDYVQINEEGNFASYYIAQVCRKRDLKFGIYQGMYRVLSGRKWALYEAIHHKIFRPTLRKYSIGAFCKTTEASDFLRSKGYERTYVVPVGLDFSKFEDRKDRDWRSYLQLGENDQLVLYVGTLEKRRNPLFIVELARLAEPHQHFVIVGSGPDRADIETIQEQSDLRNLHLVGQLTQRELPALYEQADAFILPSDYEIYGMVVAESLFFGTPVISTDTAGPADIILDEIQGRVIPTLNANEWLNALASYSGAHDDIQNSAERKSYAMRRFDWVNIAQEYIRLISIES